MLTRNRKTLLSTTLVLMAISTTIPNSAPESLAAEVTSSGSTIQDSWDAVAI